MQRTYINVWQRNIKILRLDDWGGHRHHGLLETLILIETLVWLVVLAVVVIVHTYSLLPTSSSSSSLATTIVTTRVVSAPVVESSLISSLHDITSKLIVTRHSVITHLALFIRVVLFYTIPSP